MTRTRAFKRPVRMMRVLTGGGAQCCFRVLIGSFRQTVSMRMDTGRSEALLKDRNMGIRQGEGARPWQHGYIVYSAHFPATFYYRKIWSPFVSTHKWARPEGLCSMYVIKAPFFLFFITTLTSKYSSGSINLWFKINTTSTTTTTKKKIIYLLYYYWNFTLIT